MKQGDVLNIKSTLLLTSIIRLSVTSAAFGLMIVIILSHFSHLLHAVSVGIIIAGILLFLFLVMIKENREEQNIKEMTNWVKATYGLDLNKKHAWELVHYGNVGLVKGQDMIQLVLVERNGKFSLHGTRELEILKEME